MCRSIAKYLLFAFNIIFWLAGAVCLGVGIWMNVDSSITESIDIAGVDVFYVGAWILIAAGAIMFVVGFFGCCGAIKESKCFLGLYFGSLLVLFGLEVGIGIYCIVEYDSFEEGINDALEKIDLTTTSDQNLLVATQKNLQCCGKTKGCKDWNDVNLESMGCGCMPENVQNKSFCIELSSNVGCRNDPDVPDVGGINYLYAQPCNKALSTFIGENFIIIGAVALAIGLIEIIGMIIAMSLCCSIDD